VPELVGLDVAGEAEPWRAAGFTVDDDGGIRTGHLRMQTGVGERGISAWDLSDENDIEPATHPNGTTLLDHLVVFTDDPKRTTASYGALGMDARRERDLGNGTTQTFFTASEVIIELVGPIPNVDGERFWGLAFTVADIDACAALLAPAMGQIKDAVQAGRRIVTMRHKEVGLTVPIAFMSP
jgi:hypothetical protein